MLRSNAAMMEATLAGIAASYGLTTTSLPVLEQVVAVAADVAQQGFPQAVAAFQAVYQAQWRAQYDAAAAEAGIGCHLRAGHKGRTPSQPEAT